MSYRLCPLCGNDKQLLLDHYSRKEWKNVQCSSCDFVFLANPVTYEALSDEHAWEKNLAKETAYRRKDRPILDFISKNTRFRLRIFGKNKIKNLFLKVFKKGHIVDIGCGGGISLPEPLIPYGIEISKELSKIAHSHMK